MTKSQIYVIISVDASGVIGFTSSSKSYKEDIRNWGIKTEYVIKLRATRFKWKAIGEDDIGLIAEEVEKVAKELVIYDNEGRPNGVKYDKVAVYLLEIVKAQQQSIAVLKRKIERLEN